MAALAGKTAIVTGASSGIGASTARALAREGARVAGGARRVDRLETDVRLTNVAGLIPLHVNIDEIVVEALAQSSSARVVRAG